MRSGLAGVCHFWAMEPDEWVKQRNDPLAILREELRAKDRQIENKSAKVDVETVLHYFQISASVCKNPRFTLVKGIKHQFIEEDEWLTIRTFS